MERLTLQAGSTFWLYDEQRWVFQGSEFTIEAKDFPRFAEVAKEVVAGELPSEPGPTSFARAVIDGVKKLVQQDPDKWPCPQCDRVFKAEKGLEIHMKNAHKEPASASNASE